MPLSPTVQTHLRGREHALDEVGAPGGAAAEAVDGLPHGLERRRRVDLRPAAARRPVGGGQSCALGLGAHACTARLAFLVVRGEWRGLSGCP
jgi:hypothetical protein